MELDPKQLKDFKVLGQAPSDCGCSPSPVGLQSAPAPIDMDLPFIEGEHQAQTGAVPRVSSDLKFADHFGAFKARWGVGRMDYAIPPGLYALGAPDSDSEVLVTANYKLTFDKLRSFLSGRNLWILVLDTVGINVWCAAGKGTFGTAELVQRIAVCRLQEVVNHRRLILPQLGAPGVAAHLVKEQSGFKVVYGPILANDLPAFLDAGRKATPEMRRKAFSASERVVLIPLEITGAFVPLILISAAFFFLSGLGGPGDYWANVMSSGLLAIFALVGVLLGGAVLTPLLLPWLPGKAFSLKSLPVGLAMAGLAIFWRGGDFTQWPALIEAGAWLLIAPSLTAYMAMNFTGASTYTSLSGVKKEMRIAVPAQLAGAAVGLVLWITSRIVA